LEVAAVVETAWRASGKPRLALSRASFLRGAGWAADTEELPVVAGRTVWGAIADSAEAFVVGEQPNFFGRSESAFDARVDLWIRWWDGVGDLPEPVFTADRVSGSVDTAKHLATALRTISGVKLPHGPPQAPWLVLSLQSGADNVARALADAGWPTAVPLGHSFPEFPGGLHLEVAWPRQDNGEMAATIRAALEMDLESS
jgi:hypothetical protein